MFSLWKTAGEYGGVPDGVLLLAFAIDFLLRFGFLALLLMGVPSLIFRSRSRRTPSSSATPAPIPFATTPADRPPPEPGTRERAHLPRWSIRARLGSVVLSALMVASLVGYTQLTGRRAEAQEVIDRDHLESLLSLVVDFSAISYCTKWESVWIAKASRHQNTNVAHFLYSTELTPPDLSAEAQRISEFGRDLLQDALSFVSGDFEGSGDDLDARQRALFEATYTHLQDEQGLADFTDPDRSTKAREFWTAHACRDLANQILDP